MSISVFLAGCASVKNNYVLPEQNLAAPVPDSKTRVIFYNGNGLNPLFLDGSWRVGIKVDGVGVENLHVGKYVQLFLSPGNYKVELSHIDLIAFRDNYDIQVGSKPLYIKVYNTPISTKYEVQEAEPEDFPKKYKSAANK